MCNGNNHCITKEFRNRSVNIWYGIFEIFNNKWINQTSTKLFHPNTKEYTFYSTTHGLFFNGINSVEKKDILKNF